ncbi:MAG TPA: ribosomal L7Ae/L30e/S12e/Gadd45 family protein [archaeon]|nr:ribosomal L7Ae/L30e/S12e/Gadd45 family protein [archaeon]
MTNANTILDIIETARETGKIRKGVNEATKALERGIAKLVVIADDVDPKEIVMHFQPLCDEKKSILVSVPSKNELGRAAGLNVSCAAIAVVDAGEAAKKMKDLEKE